MLQYAIKRTLYSILIVWGVVTLVFILFNVIPGDPARMVMGQRTDEASLAAVRKDLGVDKPMVFQYLKYINDLLPLSLHNPRNPENLYLLRQIRLQTSLQHWYKQIEGTGDKIPLPSPFVSKRKTGEHHYWRGFSKHAYTGHHGHDLCHGFGDYFGIIAAIFKNNLGDRLLVTLCLRHEHSVVFAAILFGWLFAFVLGDLTGLNLTGNLWEVDDFNEE